MLKQRYYRLAMCLAMIAVLWFDAAAQQAKSSAPEMSVAGIRLGDRASARGFLSEYAPTTDENGRPAFYFYNSYADQVMKVTSAAPDDLYFITEITVFGINDSYQRKHFQLKKTTHFLTESKIFIGWRQSVSSILLFPGMSDDEQVSPKSLVKKKGEPNARFKEGKQEIVAYNLPTVEVADEAGENKTKQFSYTASYEFYKNKLTKFSLKIAPPEKIQTAAKD
jgi:hypothetical protein